MEKGHGEGYTFGEEEKDGDGVLWSSEDKEGWWDFFLSQVLDIIANKILPCFAAQSEIIRKIIFSPQL